ncbi:MAG: hypothetical protein WCR01_15375 [Bacteroidota bacterium]
MKISEDYSQNAGIVDIADEETIYYCYPELGTTSEIQAKWAICRAKKNGTAWYYQWAEGSLERTFKASERLTLDYSWIK